MRFAGFTNWIPRLREDDGDVGGSAGIGDDEKSSTVGASTCISKPRSQPINRQMQRPPRPLLNIPRPYAANEFYL